MMAITKLPSERVVLAAPMSFTGSAKRLWKLTRRSAEPIPHALLTTLAIALIAVAWTVIAAWYLLIVVFPPMWLFIVYRLFRRSQRRDRRNARQHRETLAMIASDRKQN